MSVAAIHTTTDLLDQVMLDLAQYPEIFPRLREEIMKCLRDHGWSKTALYNMKLLDSVIRESQRLKPASIASMRRWVGKNITLSSGFQLRKGTRINVDAARMWDPELYENADQWQPDRFSRLREQEGLEHSAQLVSTSPDHLAFGHGQHACPGRFFAANEIKVALCHLMLNYDWKLAPGTSTVPFMSGISAIASPTAKILIRGRKELVDIDGI